MTSTANGKPWALITGASAGIGATFARALARKGLNCVLVARRKDRLDELAAELTRDHGVECRVFPQDLGEFDAPKRLFEYTQAQGLEISTLINNAGFGSHGKFIELDPEWEMRMIDVNCRALVGISRMYAPRMAERGRGQIVHLASVAAFQPCPYMSTYGATKAFILMFSEALWAEMLAHGVHVTAVCPGPTQSEFFQVARYGAARGREFVVETSEVVVERGLAALEANRLYMVSGFINWMKAFAVRFFPRSLVARVAAFILTPGKH